MREMKLDWTWAAALTVFTLALVLGGQSANDTGDPCRKMTGTSYKAERNNRGQITDDSGSRTGKFLNLFSVIR